MKLLSEFETARCLAAIEAVSRLGKPVAEVGDRKCNPDEAKALLDDLNRCLALAGEPGIRGYIHRYKPERVSFGFYRHGWTLSALQFLADTQLPELHKDWISGLLFGYSPESIDSFVSTSASAAPTSTSQRGDGAGTAGTSRPSRERSRTRSPTSDRFQTTG